jgi:hypothetical protein
VCARARHAEAPVIPALAYVLRVAVKGELVAAVVVEDGGKGALAGLAACGADDAARLRCADANLARGAHIVDVSLGN